MRRHTLRRGLRTAGIVERARETEESKLARLTREIVEAAGAQAPILLRLIERRAPNVRASESADFILRAWTSGGADRDRLIAHAMKSDAALATERRIAREVQRTLRAFAGKPFTAATAQRIRTALAKYLRKAAPGVDDAAIQSALNVAVELADQKLVIRTELLAAAMSPPRTPS